MYLSVKGLVRWLATLLKLSNEQNKNYTESLYRQIVGFLLFVELFLLFVELFKMVLTQAPDLAA